METLQRFDELKELKKKIQDFDSLVASIDDIIFEIRNDGVILNCWTAEPNQLYFDKDYIINKSVKELFPSEFSDTIIYILEKSFRKRTGYSLKYKSPFSDNIDHWYKLQTKIIKNRTESLTVVVTNITREQKLLAKIQIKEEKFNRAFQNSSIGMLLLSKSLKVIEYNQELQNILDYANAAEMLEKKVPEFIHENYADHIQSAFNEVKNGIKEKAIIEAQCLAKGDKAIFCLINISSIRDANGKVVYFLCQIQDLSLFKSNEAKLNQQNEMLEQMNYELKVKVNQLESFNQILAHNLRTPISNIEMIVNQIAQENDNDQKELLLNLLKISNNKFLRLFDKLIETLDVQITNNYLFQTSEIDEIILKLTKDFQHQISSNSLTIDYHLDVKTIAFPTENLYCIFKFLITESLRKYQTLNTIKININTWQMDNDIFISIENNCESQRSYEIETEFMKINENIDENFLMELHMAKQQIQFFGGTYKIFKKEDVGNKVVISLPKSK